MFLSSTCSSTKSLNKSMNHSMHLCVNGHMFYSSAGSVKMLPLIINCQMYRSTEEPTLISLLQYTHRSWSTKTDFLGWFGPPHFKWASLSSFGFKKKKKNREVYSKRMKQFMGWVVLLRPLTTLKIYGYLKAICGWGSYCDVLKA